jgi:tryptophan synthase alpha chain
VIGGIRKIRERGYRQPIYLTSYYGPIFKIGVEKFVKKAKEAKVTGLIIPDILLEEQGELRKACDKHSLSLIQFATVYSTKERLEKIIRASTNLPVQASFIYCISLPGVTGDTPSKGSSEHLEGGRMPVCRTGRDSFQVNLYRLVRRLKSMTDRPIYVGFGIKSGQDVRKIIKMGADGVIVGSAIARIYEENLDNPYKSLGKISAFIKSIKDVL